MRVFLNVIFFGLTLSMSNAQAVTDPAYAGDPLQFFQIAEQEVKTAYPNAKLLFMSTFISGSPDPACSQLGWQYIYQDDTQSVGIRKSLRHLSDSDGKCSYASDPALAVDKEDYPLMGYQAIEGRLHLVATTMNDSLNIAKSSVGNDFVPYWLGLKTPLYPGVAGKLFWSFRGPVNCKKIAEVFIDAASGAINPRLSNIPTCP